MTGDHEQATYDSRSQNGTTTTSGPAPGWYTDPGDAAQLRFFDGSAWTHHVAPRTAPAPATVAAPGHIAAPPYSATSGYGAAPAYGTGPAWATVPTTSSGSFSVVRVVITVVLVLIVLSGIAGGLRGVAKGGAQAQRAAGPALTLSNVAPETVLGRLPSTGPAAERNRAALRGQLQAGMGTIPGAGAPGFELYGPGPKAAPARGLGVVMVAWTPSSTPFGQDQFAAGFSEGAVRAFDGRATTTTAPDGGVVVCHESVQLEQQTTLCVWIRSGTGLVMLSEYDVPTDTVRTDLAGLVQQMARP